MQIIGYTRAGAALPSKLVSVLPPRLVQAVRECGAPHVEELRLHAERHCTVTCGGRDYAVRIMLSASEMQDILKSMCGGSLYAYSQTICQGYVTMEGGIRVGVCGRAAVEGGRIIGVGEITGLTVRVPRSLSIRTDEVLQRLFTNGGNLRGMLVYAPPGAGKTTLLRALARALASPTYGKHTVVVDTREELAYTLEDPDLRLNVLAGYPRGIGIEIAVRSLSAQAVICDEIGDERDADAILAAAGCGVPIIASAHAACVEELLTRPALLRLHRARAFSVYTGIRRGGEGCFRYRFTSREEADATLERRGPP